MDGCSATAISAPTPAKGRHSWCPESRGLPTRSITNAAASRLRSRSGGRRVPTAVRQRGRTTGLTLAPRWASALTSERRRALARGRVPALARALARARARARVRAPAQGRTRASVRALAPVLPRGPPVQVIIPIRRTCDAEITPVPSDESSAQSSDAVSGTSDGEPPIELIEDSGAEDVVEPPPSPIYQPAISTNQVRLPVDQFKEYMADLAVHAFTVRHDLTQAAIADLLRLSSFAIK